VTVATVQESEPTSVPEPSSNVRGCCSVSSGRIWWAHFEFTRINITPTILPKKTEDLMNVRGIGEKNFLKLKALVTVGAVKGGDAQ